MPRLLTNNRLLYNTLLPLLPPRGTDRLLDRSVAGSESSYNPCHSLTADRVGTPWKRLGFRIARGTRRVEDSRSRYVISISWQRALTGSGNLPLQQTTNYATRNAARNERNFHMLSQSSRSAVPIFAVKNLQNKEVWRYDLIIICLLNTHSTHIRQCTCLYSIGLIAGKFLPIEYNEHYAVSRRHFSREAGHSASCCVEISNKHLRYSFPLYVLDIHRFFTVIKWSTACIVGPGINRVHYFFLQARPTSRLQLTAHSNDDCMRIRMTNISRGSAVFRNIGPRPTTTICKRMSSLSLFLVFRNLHKQIFRCSQFVGLC